MELSPYLQLNGNAKEAIDFYENTFGAKNLGIMTYGDLPEDSGFSLPENTKDLISHSALEIENSKIMIVDTFPGYPSQEGNVVIICITLNNKNKASQIFEDLGKEGQIEMPLSETGFSPAFGVVKDKFGVRFQIYTEVNE